MNHHFTILGNHNFGISLIMENLLSCFGRNITVDIIALTLEEDNKLSEYEYAVSGIIFRLIYFDNWTKPKSTKYLNSGMSGNSRKHIYEFFKDKFEIEKEAYSSCFHDTSVIASSASIGHGCYIGPNVCIAPFTSMGDFSFINRNSSIGHHSGIDHFVIISAGCSLASRVHVDSGTYIGIGATVIDNTTIGKNSLIGAGSVVTKNVADGVVVYGVPAKLIRNNKS